MPVTSYALAIGSNRRHHRHGAPVGVVRAAADAVAELGEVTALSPILTTAPLGPAGRSFANAALLLETALTPPELLRALKAVERGFGRRPGRRWGPRVLDLDIVLWSGGACSGAELTIPHPAFRTRNFVLAPLAAIAAGWRDPLTGLRVRHLRALVDRRAPSP